MAQVAPKAKTVTARELRKARELASRRFLAGRRAEAEYARSLRSVAQQIGTIIKGFMNGENLATAMTEARSALERYAELLGPWAKSVASKMTNEVARRDAGAWASVGKEMGRALSKEIRTAPTGKTLRNELNYQIDLIKSIPRRAAERVHELALRAVIGGKRSEFIEREIMRSGKVAAFQARTIARTEVARVSSLLTQVRAEHVGAEGYIWRTALDGDVRPLHRRLEGKFIRFSDPPISGENGERAHAGQIYNCRCFMEPVLPELIR